jgi:carboxyl-terminal processing protease
MSGKLKLALIPIIITLSLVISTIGCFPFSSETQTDNELDIELLNEAYKVIQDNYVDQSKLDEVTLTEGAIKGMVEALDDRHTAYLTKEMVDFSKSMMSGQFEGIGASITLNEVGRIVVIAPLAGSPAEKAGIQADDLILEIDGESTEGMSTYEAALLVRGPKGTTVSLTVLHKGDAAPVILEITRDEIKTNSVFFEMKGDIAYLQITEFTERTEEELVPVLEIISQNGTKGIIIDLRGNPGGIVDVVVNTASHFLDIGEILKIVYRDGHSNTYMSQDVTPKLDLPMVVLVDENSASSSEVFAGAMQDRERAVIAGQQTYGKGSVNILAELSDGSGIYITIARWYTPSGHLIEGEGIRPDYLLDMDTIDAIQWAIDYLHNNMS